MRLCPGPEARGTATSVNRQIVVFKRSTPYVHP